MRRLAFPEFQTRQKWQLKRTLAEVANLTLNLKSKVVELSKMVLPPAPFFSLRGFSRAGIGKMKILNRIYQ